MELKEFSQSDWYAWASAERFRDGSNPLIAEFGVARAAAALIVDYDRDTDQTVMSLSFADGDTGVVYDVLSQVYDTKEDAIEVGNKLLRLLVVSQ